MAVDVTPPPELALTDQYPLEDWKYEMRDALRKYGILKSRKVIYLILRPNGSTNGRLDNHKGPTK